MRASTEIAPEPVQRPIYESMKNSCTYALMGVLAIAIAPVLTASNWPGWRGPNGTGVSTEKNLPLKWSKTENVRWRVDLRSATSRSS